MSANAPLAGLRVVDFSRVLAGPHCTKALSDLGADVIKIEPPRGDISRLALPGDATSSISRYYIQQNAGKRNISIDLNYPEAREVVRRMCDTADIIVENFRAGTLKFFGLDYDSVAARNPRVIYASISGYGQGSPLSHRSAYAPTVHAESGFVNGMIEHMGGDLSTPRHDAYLRANAEEYAQYITLDMGKLIGESRAEVGLSADILDYYAARAEGFLAPQPLPESPGAVVETRPIGVILAIEPWNFPYYQIARVAGPQLAVGNVLLLKHAENVPQCALAFARLFEAAGAPAGVYTNLFVSIEQIGHVIDDSRVRGVTVTGSERAGAAVAERAGRALKKSVMELGGSDPLIVLEDAPLEPTLDSALFARMFNAGQCCVASKRIIVVGQERG